MPWLRKKPFQRLHVSSDYRDDDDVFHCEVTNEVFKDYNEYCERIILCNSTIWSCSITGKTNMTYEEALACEENAKASLKEFPMELRIPILYLASRTNRSSFSEMIEDVYQYARDRYFIGEMVEASFTEDSWCECHVLQVIEPDEEQIKAYLKENPKQSPQERHYDCPAKLFRYEVEQLDCGDSDANQLTIVEASQIRRKKQLYSRERNKIFLRMLCQQTTSGSWIVKDEIQQKYGIPKVRFDSIFAGPIPDFSNLPKRPVVMKQKQGTLDKFLTSNPSKSTQDAFKPSKPVENNHVVKKRGPKAGSKLNGKYKEDQKAKAEEVKAKKKEERILKREKKKEERKKLAAFSAFLRDWQRPREDLECEDLRPIPEPTPVNCRIPDENFGDFVMIMEFLQFFHEELEVSSYFPGGLTLEILEKALLPKETSGPWSDLLQLLLANIFKHQAEEEDEIHEANSAEGLDEASMDHGVSSMAEAVKLATLASTWSQTHQGYQLSELALDHVTVSEILRQHLLSSGGRFSEVASKWRYSQRGGYTNHDDPALALRIMQARILRTLGHRSVCEFELQDRLIVATCLINQLLTFASIRDVIEERYDKLHQARRELKSFIVAEQKKEKEEREKMKEEKEKMKEEGGKLIDEIDERPRKTRGSREEEKKREDYEGRLGELRQAAKDDGMMLLLGMDRAFRRYWRLLSVPGIFVEDNEEHPGVCLEGGTNYIPELQDKTTAETYLRRKFEDEKSDNKENDFNKSKKKKNVSFDKKEKNGLKSPRKDSDIRRSLIACTGDKDCPVHQLRTRSKWSFFGRQEEIEALITGLSIRGIREGELRNNLIQESESIALALTNCPKHKLNPDVFSSTNNNNNSSSKSRKSKQENTNLNFPPDVPIDEVLELTLRDYVLDLEDKLKVGCLGSLKVKDRDTWRKEVGTTGVDATGLNSAIDKIKNETRNSRPGTPDSEVGTGGKTYRDPGKYLGPPGDDEVLPDGRQQVNIRQMAGSILQLFHAVEPKYLKRPLGNDDKDKKYSCEEMREKWEQSLLASTSWSQLFLHLNTLEGSVAWGKSALHARCRICRKCKDAEHMLLCDGCNKGQHLYCLKPQLTSVPEGDWFCSTCRPKETKPKPKAKKRKKFEEEDEEEELTKDEEEVEVKEEEEEEISESHIVKPRKIETCSQCNSSGRLFGCDICNKLFHLDCVEPPMSRAPRGRWLCHDCKNLKKNATKFVKGRERERETERQCAAAARSRIHGFAKSLLSTESSNWWDDGNASDEVEQRQTRRATKRAAAVQDKTLHDLLNDVMHHRDSWPFLSPVRADEVPDYYEFIKKPMDFGTIKGKLEAGAYEKDSHLFFNDCTLIFNNCHTYNADHSAVYKAGMRLSKYFEKRSREMGFNYEEEAHRPPPAKKFKEDPAQKAPSNGSLEAVDS